MQEELFDDWKEKEMLSRRKIIQRLYSIPSLRPQIPRLLDLKRREYFALRDKADKTWDEFKEMENEYQRLLGE